MDNMHHLSAGASPNLELVPASDAARVGELLATTNALLIATDDAGTVVNPAVLGYLLDPTRAPCP